MANFIDSTLGIYPEALRVHEKCAKLISANLANENTPNYKAIDLDFRAVMQEVNNKATQGDNTSFSRDVRKNDIMGSMANYVKYRTMSQPSADGNTVDGRAEQAAFSENSIRYLASLNTLDNRVKNIMLAIKGTS